MKNIRWIMIATFAMGTLVFMGACGNQQKSETASSSKVSQSVSKGKSESKSSLTDSSESKDEAKETNSSANIASSEEKEVTSSSKTQANSETKIAGMDIQTLANGDYSSIAGTWQDDLGNQLVFDANGLLSHTYRGNESSDYTLVDGQIFEGKYTAILANKAGHHIASFTAIPKGARLYDTGNENPKERILVGQDFTYASQHPYYRVAN